MGKGCGGPGAPPAGAGGPRRVMGPGGLRGGEKTTPAAKLANLLRKQGRHPLLVAADVHRPAAIDQLTTLGKQLGVPVRAVRADRVAADVATIAGAAGTAGRDTGIGVTAGRPRHVVGVS